jgi:hypothetical protein
MEIPKKREIRKSRMSCDYKLLITSNLIDNQ